MRAFNYKLSTGRNVTFVSLVILHFLDGSYDFRAGCSPHYALQVLRVQIVSKKVNRVLEGAMARSGLRRHARANPKKEAGQLSDKSLR
jgi:hypothetical protein